jgi:hypothetical protein
MDVRGEVKWAYARCDSELIGQGARSTAPFGRACARWIRMDRALDRLRHRAKRARSMTPMDRTRDRWRQWARFVRWCQAWVGRAIDCGVGQVSRSFVSREGRVLVAPMRNARVRRRLRTGRARPLPTGPCVRPMVPLYRARERWHHRAALALCRRYIARARWRHTLRVARSMAPICISCAHVCVWARCALAVARGEGARSMARLSNARARFAHCGHLVRSLAPMGKLWRQCTWRALNRAVAQAPRPTVPFGRSSIRWRRWAGRGIVGADGQDARSLAPFGRARHQWRQL